MVNQRLLKDVQNDKSDLLLLRCKEKELCAVLCVLFTDSACLPRWNRASRVMEFGSNWDPKDVGFYVSSVLVRFESTVICFETFVTPTSSKNAVPNETRWSSVVRRDRAGSAGRQSCFLTFCKGMRTVDEVGINEEGANISWIYCFIFVQQPTSRLISPWRLLSLCFPYYYYNFCCCYLTGAAAFLWMTCKRHEACRKRQRYSKSCKKAAAACQQQQDVNRFVCQVERPWCRTR